MPAPENAPESPRAKIVLFVDDSPHWHDLARLVGRYARDVGGEVVVLSTILLPGGRQRALEKAERLLALPAGRVRLVGRPGLMEYVLPELAREERAHVAVVGRLGSADRLTNGLIAHLVVKHTPSSVLIARARPARVRSILVCTEGSIHGAADLERAIPIARAFGARIRVLHVVSQMGLTASGRAELEADLKNFLEADRPEAVHLRELAQRLRAANIPGDVEVRSGLVVEEILAAIQQGKHDLLVIGAHEDRGKGRYLYEDVASNILRASPISVLVVRGRPERPG